MPFSEMKIGDRQFLHELTIDGKTYRYRDKRTSIDDDTINMAELGMGFSTRQVGYSTTATVDWNSVNLDPSKKKTTEGILTVYQRPYSVVHSLVLPSHNGLTYGASVGSGFTIDSGCIDVNRMDCTYEVGSGSGSIGTFGHRTENSVVDNIAKNNQKFNYSGDAFTLAAVPERGVFKYQINFGSGHGYYIPGAKGSGSITGFNSVGDITLGSDGDLDALDRSITGTATDSKNGKIGNFHLHFFGPNAEEVAGTGRIPETGTDANGKKTDTVFGFSGVR